MIINSPVGRFPFAVTGVSVQNWQLRLEGQMGTWPTSVEVRASDLPVVLSRVVPRHTVVRIVAALLGLWVVRAVRKH